MGGGVENALSLTALDDAGPDYGEIAWVSIDDAFFDRALRLEKLAKPPRMESLEARIATMGDVPEGVVCWLHVDGRATQAQTELGLGRLAIAVRAKEASGPALLERSIYIEPVWTAIDLSFAAPSDFDVGELEVAFGVGTQPQILDLTGLSMRCFDESDALPKWPDTAFSYAGREADASWRQTADNRIERYRKSDLAIDVTDDSGQSVPDAEIHIQMLRHAFTFGAAIDAERLLDDVDNSDREAATASYRKNLGELFNTITFKERLRWTNWRDQSQRDTTEEALDWARSLGLEPRGRGLAFSAIDDLPLNLQENLDEPGLVEGAIRLGIGTTAGDLKGRIGAWEMIDPSLGYLELIDLVDEQELASWFRLAEQAHAEAKLVLSGDDPLAGDGLAELIDLAQRFVNQDIPIDQIGLQGRFETQPPPVERLINRFDLLAGLNLPLVVTAFDLNTEDLALSSDFTNDFLTLAFSHPSVTGFIFEHFQESEEQKTPTTLFYQDGTVSPIGQVYRDLVLGHWWSDIVASSNAEGRLTSRVFQGDYRITARKGDKSAFVMLTVGPDAETVTLELAAAS